MFYSLGVIGNLTHLKYLDLSYNKLYDVSSDLDVFQLPTNISEIYLTGNILTDLPWTNLLNASQLRVLDIRNNQFEEFSPYLTKMVTNNVDIFYEGNIF